MKITLCSCSVPMLTLHGCNFGDMHRDGATFALNHILK